MAGNRGSPQPLGIPKTAKNKFANSCKSKCPGIDNKGNISPRRAQISSGRISPGILQSLAWRSLQSAARVQPGSPASATSSIDAAQRIEIARPATDMRSAARSLPAAVIFVYCAAQIGGRDSPARRRAPVPFAVA
jgi:hypothetical protein